MKMSDAANFLSGGTPKKDNTAYWGGNIPWFSASNMDRRFLSTSEFNLTEAGLAKGSRLAPAGSTLLLVRGSGLFNYIPICFAERDVAFNQDVKALTPKHGVDPVFLHYALEIQRRNLADNLDVTGIGAGKFDTDFLKNLPFPNVDKRDQPRIGELAASFDRKIELNRQMNATLEAMAQAIFQDWFVDFGPVRRKIEGATDPVKILGGLVGDQAQADNMAALFPQALSAEGIPIGWSIETLEDALTLAYGKALPKTARIEGSVPVYGSGGIGGSHDVALVQGPGIIVGRKGTVGSLFWEAGDFYAIDTVFYVQPKLGFSLEYLWQLLQTLGLEKMNTDAAVPGLNRNNAYRLEIVSSDQPVRDAFTELAKSLRNRIDAAEAESRALAETRDYLLPRLMSGKVVACESEGGAS
ncbi:hypothetical protein GRI58_13055 [Porphyrobacter algicida]|uniref:Type I restriction modification DNA specificity domain-containing protein n=1 Tax=Qipengyuania algicida TaxID=1836209 RepID=A0A845AMJ3_9SPHN|nr:restriction endonuclease subunit S [Qipengyuania algicida]MXP29736.1 hypothetical protein [Qipengyuania algicida]